MSKLQSVKYELVTSKCKTDGAEGSTVYGIKTLNAFNRNSNAEFEDISANKTVVERLLSLLHKVDVAPDQMFYIIEDSII